MSKTINVVSKHKDYKLYKSMRARCYCKGSSRFKYYGGNGIVICSRWLEPDGNGFRNFIADMGERPSNKHSIDRINPSGNYEPNNCRWVTQDVQTNNRNSFNRRYTYDGQTKTIADWAKKYNLKYNTLRDRIQKYGYSMQDALKMPVGSLR